MSPPDGDEPPAPGIQTLHLNITNSCNLGCAFCYIDAQRESTYEMPLDVIEAIAEDFKNLGGEKVILSGGEPFVRSDWEDLFRIWANHGIRLSVASNGTLLSVADVRKQLATFPELDFQVSLDGSEHTHDALRGVPGSYRRTLEGIRGLREANIPVQVGCTICNDNVDDVRELTKLSRELDVTVAFGVMNPYSGRGEEVAERAIPLETIFELRDYCHVVRKLGADVYLKLPPLMLYPDDVVPVRRPSCGWTDSFCGILHTGDVTICGVAGDVTELVAGNVNEQPFAEIWSQSPLFNRLKSYRTDDLTGVCGVCPYRDVCGGGCRLLAYKVYGDMLGPSPLCQRSYEEGFIPAEILDRPTD